MLLAYLRPLLNLEARVVVIVILFRVLIVKDCLHVFKRDGNVVHVRPLAHAVTCILQVDHSLKGLVAVIQLIEVHLKDGLYQS